MKNIILLLIASILMTSFTALEKQPIGDNSTYYVMALSGLKMRNAPNLQGEKITTIPYNGKVELKETGFGTLKIEEIKDFYIEGEWVKVQYNGNEGYVFSGYLTQFILPDLDIEYEYEKYSSEVEHYLEQKFIQEKKFNIHKYDYDCDESNHSCTCGYSIEYENGIFYNWNSCDEKGLSFYAEIDNITLAEAYFIYRALDMNETRGTKFEDEIIHKYHKESRSLTIDPDGAGCWATIKQRKRNSIEIDGRCGC